MVSDPEPVSAPRGRRRWLAIALIAAGGCAARPLYHWGSYEDLVYQMYTSPGKADPATQIERLSRDISAAESRGERVAPGVHLHLGWVYAQQGNPQAARQEMEAEKRLFPESTRLVDRLLASLESR